MVAILEEDISSHYLDSKRSWDSLALSEVSNATFALSTDSHDPFAKYEPNNTTLNPSVEEIPLAHTKVSIRGYLMADVDSQRCSIPLAFLTFLTGYLDAITLSSIFVWVGFQTGNFTQLAVGIARLIEDKKASQGPTFQMADRQALLSFLCFNLGAVLSRYGDHIGPQKRAWLLASTFVQSLLLMGASIALWESGEPSIMPAGKTANWTSPLAFLCLALISICLGMQGVLAKRLNTQFGTTLVLTTVMVEVMADPGIFRRRNSGRNQRCLALLSLFLGAFTSRVLLAGIGSAGCLGLASGFKLLISLSWLIIPSSADPRKEILGQDEKGKR